MFSVLPSRIQIKGNIPNISTSEKSEFGLFEYLKVNNYIKEIKMSKEIDDKKPSGLRGKVVSIFGAVTDSATPQAVGQEFIEKARSVPLIGVAKKLTDCPDCGARHQSVCLKKIERCKCVSCAEGLEGSLEELITTFDEERYMYDEEALKITCAVTIANFFQDTTPVWLILIGASGSGKTDFLEIFRGHDKTQFESKMTGQTLFSGKKGVPHKIWQFNDKCIFVKDLAPMQGGSGDDLKNLFGYLRDAYDGNVDVSWGSGQADAHWEGKFGLVAASTFAIDAELWRFSALGERWIRVNLISSTEITETLTHSANSNRYGQGESMARLRVKAHAFLNTLIAKAQNVSALNPIEFREELLRRVEGIAIVGAKLRTPVRMTQAGKYIQSNQPEEPTRLVKQLRTLAESSAILNDREHVTVDDMELVLRVAYDGISNRRQRILRALLEGKTSTRGIAEYIGGGKGTIARELEMLQEIKVVQHKDGKWTLLPSIENQIDASGLVPRIMKTDLSWEQELEDWDNERN